MYNHLLVLRRDPSSRQSCIKAFILMYRLLCSLSYRAVRSSFWLGGGGGLKLKFGSPSRALQVRGFIGEIF